MFSFPFFLCVFVWFPGVRLTASPIQCTQFGPKKQKANKKYWFNFGIPLKANNLRFQSVLFSIQPICGEKPIWQKSIDSLKSLFWKNEKSEFKLTFCIFFVLFAGKLVAFRRHGNSLQLETKDDAVMSFALEWHFSIRLRLALSTASPTGRIHY